MKIEEVFDSRNFRIEKIVLENNSPSRKFLIFVNGYRYFIRYENLFRFLKNEDINLEEEIRRLRIPTERIDTRPLYQKAMDVQMGKRVDFKKPATYPFRDEMFLKRTLIKEKDL